jgi:hypothetical protein
MNRDRSGAGEHKRILAHAASNSVNDMTRRLFAIFCKRFQ